MKWNNVSLCQKKTTIIELLPGEMYFERLWFSCIIILSSFNIASVHESKLHQIKLSFSNFITSIICFRHCISHSVLTPYPLHITPNQRKHPNLTQTPPNHPHDNTPPTTYKYNSAETPRYSSRTNRSTPA